MMSSPPPHFPIPTRSARPQEDEWPQPEPFLQDPQERTSTHPSRVHCRKIKRDHSCKSRFLSTSHERRPTHCAPPSPPTQLQIASYALSNAAQRASSASRHLLKFICVLSMHLRYVSNSDGHLESISRNLKSGR